MLKSSHELQGYREATPLRPLLKRYSLRYFLAGSDREALIDQTLAALAADPDTAFEAPVEKAVARVMHKVFTANFGQRST